MNPEKILEVFDDKIGLHGILVIDNTKLGIAKGGLRMTANVSVEEVKRLARIMTWKCALVELPFGGGKSGIIWDRTKSFRDHKHRLIHRFGEMVKPFCPSQYCSAPDIGTGEEEMATFSRAIRSKRACTGKPEKLGGIPHELGSTGYGVAYVTKMFAEKILPYTNDKRWTVAIDGFGNVGSFTAKFLYDLGYKIVAVSDSKGCVHNPDGLNIPKVIEEKKKFGSVTSFPFGRVSHYSNLFTLPVDIIVTASIPDVIHENNMNFVQAKLIIEGSNIPMTYEVEKYLQSKGVYVVPDFLANSGGVISSYVEYVNGESGTVFPLIRERIAKAVRKVLRLKDKRPLRAKAIDIAKRRLGK